MASKVFLTDSPPVRETEKAYCFSFDISHDIGQGGKLKNREVWFPKSVISTEVDDVYGIQYYCATWFAIKSGIK